MSQHQFASDEDAPLHSPPIDVLHGTEQDSQPNEQETQGTESDSQPLDIEGIYIPVSSRQDVITQQENIQPRGVQKKKKLTRVTFDDATEMELAEWYANNRIFYDKSLKDYKDSGKKKRIIEEKASSLNRTNS